MQFDFTSLAFGGENHIVRWDAERIRTLKPDDAQNLAKILEVFGKHSAAAQSLGAPITDILRLRSTDQRLYLYMYRQSSRTVVLGGIKVGTKRLFVRTISAELREIEPLCVLDFYVHESCQRQGVGKELFEHMLTAEGVDPGMLAYDRPSPKLIAFLKKHYGLTEYVPQSNNYVVFNRFWELCPSGGPGSQHKGRSGIRVGGSAGGHPHPLHAPRSTPPPGGWGPGMSPVPTSPLVGGTPTAQHQSPSFGQRWAASNFGSTGGAVEASSTGQRTLPQGSMDEPYDSGYGTNYPHAGDSLDEFSRGHATGPHQLQQQLPPASLQRSPMPGMAPYLGEPGAGTGTGMGIGMGPAMAQGGFGGGAMGSGRHGHMPPGSSSNHRPYASRPPWAVDEPAGTGTGLGMGMGGQQGAGYGHTVGSPQAVGQGAVGGYGEAGGVPYGRSPGRPGAGREAGTPGPHTRALQDQLNAMQLQAQGGAAYAGGGAAGGPYGMGGGQQVQQRPGMGTPGSQGLGGEAPRTPGTAKMMAVAQRSGAGAADCLVW